ncbi:MAG: TspO protein, partial [Alphaproteobacteria bacterium HGW-Alphaproteobacteria-15]
MNRMMILPVAVATAAALCVAALGATVTDLGPWYQALEKPGWNPPDVLFPMGWTLIYALITIAGITAWRAAPNAA